MAMEAADLDGLLAHFDDKIDMINQLIPFAKLCNAVVSISLDDSRPPFARRELEDEAKKITAASLPDLSALTEMVAEMKTMLMTMRSKLELRRRKVEQQRERSYQRIAAAKNHVNYLQSNLPPIFRQQRLYEKSKQTQAARAATNKPKPVPAASTNTKKSVTKGSQPKTVQKVSQQKPPAGLFSNENTANLRNNRPTAAQGTSDQKAAAVKGSDKPTKRPFLKRGTGLVRYQSKSNCRDPGSQQEV